MTDAPPTLPKTDREKQRKINQLASAGHRIPFELKGAAWHLTMTLQPEEDYTPAYTLTLKAGGKPLPVWLDRWPEPGALLQQLTGFTWDDFAEEIREPITNAALAPWLDLLAEKTGIPLTPETGPRPLAAPAPANTDAAAPAANDGQENYFRVVRPPAPGPPPPPPLLWRGHARPEAGLLAAIARQVERYPRPPAPALDAIPITLRVILGQTTLEAATFAQLAPNDIILVETSQAGRCTVVAEGDAISFSAEIRQQKITLHTMTVPPGKNNPSTPAPAVAPTPVAAPAPALMAEALATLPVHLVFEIGEKQIPCKDLRTITPGYVFELDQPVEHSVTVRANGKIVATGDLVQVDDRIGVRITHLHA
jgi:type III secretion system YscQ/HrcQ family protein